MPDEMDVDGLWPTEPDSRLADFLLYWRSKFDAEGNPPRQEDINPAEIAHLMPGILILERRQTAAVLHYFYRLAGTSHYEANGLDLTGRYVDDVYSAEIAREAYDAYEQILSSGRPHYWARPNPLPDRKMSEYERIIMPLRDGDGTLSMLIGYWLWR